MPRKEVEIFEARDQADDEYRITYLPTGSHHGGGRVNHEWFKERGVLLFLEEKELDEMITALTYFRQKMKEE